MTAAPSGRRPQSIRRIAIALIGLGVSAVAIWLATRGVDLGRTAQVLIQISPGPLAIVAVVLVVELLVRSARWSLLLSAGEQGSVPARRLVPVLLVGYLGNAVLPARLGDPVRAILVARREGIPASGALGSVVLERVIDTLTLALLVFPAAALAGAPDWLIRVAAFASAVAGVVLIAAQTPLPGRTIRWLRQGVPGPRRTTWLDRADRFASAMDSAGHRRALLSAVGLSLLAWLLDGTIYWAVARSVGIDLLPAGAMLVSAITVLGTAIPSAPGYVGTFELAASTIAGGLGVAPDAALAFAILAHALTVLPPALGGVAALVWMGARFSDLARTSVARPALVTESSAAPAKTTNP